MSVDPRTAKPSSLTVMPPGPATISSTRKVPATVPSERWSSEPRTPSSATKSRIEPAAARRSTFASPVAFEVLDQHGAPFRAVRLPQLVAVGAVGGAEEESRSDGGELVKVAVGRAGADVLHQNGAAGGAVGSPELVAIGAVVGGKEERAADRGQLARLRRSPPRGRCPSTSTVPPGVPSERQSSRPVVALSAVNRTIGPSAVDLLDIRVGWSGLDVGERDRSGRRAVRSPELPSGDPVVEHEEGERARGGGLIAHARRPRRRQGDEDGSADGAVGSPDLPVGVGGDAEVELSAEQRSAGRREEVELRIGGVDVGHLEPLREGGWRCAVRGEQRDSGGWRWQVVSGSSW